MASIVQYTLVKNWNPDEVVKEVNTLLDMGWQPLGAPTITSQEGSLVIIQAMVVYN